MVLTIGTDCSGIEAPIQALLQMNIPFKHLWSCEKDPYAIQSIKANYNPEKIYNDITMRNHSELPDTDIYVCGFPCQPFSLMGHKEGTNDPRGNIMKECISVIKRKQPNIFILENVKNFKFIEKGVPFKYLVNTLSEIKNNDEEVYNVYHDILNTRDYGIPQNRERIFIIGIKKVIQTQDYTTPIKIDMKPLEEFILDKTIHNLTINKQLYKNLIIINNELNCIVTSCNYYYPIKNVSPTLTTYCSIYYHTTYKRYLTWNECLLLQGFPNNFNKVISNFQMFKQIGNSMSVNVLVALFKVLFEITIIKEIM